MDQHDEHARTKVMEIVKELNIAMLSTRGPDGKFHSRPMAVSDAEFRGKLYFLTDVRSGKTHDLETDPETIVAAAEGLGFDTPFGPASFRAIDHQSTLGAYVGKTALKDGKGIMVNSVYRNGADYLPSDAEVSKLRPKD